MENIENKEALILSKKTNSKKKLIIFLIINIIIIGCFTIGYFIIYPNYLIKIINNSYESEQYEKVSAYYSKLNIINDYLKNKNEECNLIDYKVKYSKALTLYNGANYLEAINALDTIKNPSKESNKLKNECNYNNALKYIDEKKFDVAVTYLLKVNGKEDKESLLDKCYYNISLEFLEQNKFEDALVTLKKIKNEKMKGLKDTEKEIHYKYGIDYYNSNKYNYAIDHFKKSIGYKDSDEYYNKSCILRGEEFIEAGNFSNAIKIYENVPDDINYNGINAGNRKSQLNKAIELSKFMGNRKATSTYIETRNVWKYDGRWTNWHIDTTSNEYINVSLSLNNDGSFNISGKVMFYVYDDFSTLAKYVKAKSKIKSFEFKNVYDIPFESWLDSNTKLSYSNGIYRIDYYVEDNYSINFYNIYQTNVTY